MNVKINVPDDIYRKAEAAAREQRMSVEEVLESAVKEHWQAWDALKTRAAKGSPEKFRAVMAKVPNVEPDDYDRL
jgi:hypothetical protein